MIEIPPLEKPISSTSQVTANSILTLVWLLGVVVLTLYFIIGYYRCRKEFAMSLPICDERIARIMSGTKASERIEIRMLDKLKSPVAYGLFRPVILLPKSYGNFSEEQLRHMLLHEITHIKRFDGLFKFFLAAAVCVHWFNPIVWLLFIMANRDIELYCDETVLQKLGVCSNKAYAMTLISMEERKKYTPLLNSFSKYATKERIDSIMKTSRRTIISSIAATAIVISVSAVFATSSAAETKPVITEVSQNNYSAEDFSAEFAQTQTPPPVNEKVEKALAELNAEFMEYFDYIILTSAEEFKSYNSFDEFSADYSAWFNAPFCESFSEKGIEMIEGFFADDEAVEVKWSIQMLTDAPSVHFVKSGFGSSGRTDKTPGVDEDGNRTGPSWKELVDEYLAAVTQPNFAT